MPDFPDSIFTKIINGQLPSHPVWEDDQFFAFLDIHPVQRGHVLLVPKRQVDSIWDLNEAEYSALWIRARFLAGPICQAMHAVRTGIVVEGLAVPHVHVHLIPVFKSNDLDPNRQRPASDNELLEVADLIRQAIAEKAEK